MTEHRQFVVERQEPLRRRYRSAPGDAWITDKARTAAGQHLDPFHAVVFAGDHEEMPWRIGIHRAVGGFHDLPNPGDVLCAALATCFGTTLRIIAARLSVELEDCEVRVRARVDVRGTLAVDPETPVGFQRIECSVRLRTPAGVSSERIRRVIEHAERSCVVLQTLRHGVAVRLETDTDRDSETAEG
jgi:uncharacterized OsmC-like protein